MTVEKLRELLPETADLPVAAPAADLRAVNFVVDGILGEGVAYQARSTRRPRGWASGCAAGVDIPAML